MSPTKEICERCSDPAIADYNGESLCRQHLHEAIDEDDDTIKLGGTDPWGV